MHIHGNQMNPNISLDAAYAAQQAQAKREAEATRKKLLETASQLAAANEDCIVSIGSQQEDGENQPKKNVREQRQKEDTNQDDAGNQVSDWA